MTAFFLDSLINWHFRASTGAAAIVIPFEQREK